MSETRRIIRTTNPLLWNRNFAHTTKILIHKSILKFILTYGSETWSVKRKHRHKLLAKEMDYLKRFARISRMDRIRDETFKTQMGMKDIRVL
jgi:hypothetical protein